MDLGRLRVSRGAKAAPLDIPLREVEGMPTSLFAKYVDRATNAQTKILEDTGRVISGAVLPKDAWRFFTLSQNEQGQVLTNAGPGFRKNAYDTNLQVKGGRLDFGELFLFYGMSFHYVLPVRSGTFDANGELTGAVPQAKAAGVYAASTLMEAIIHNLHLTFYRASQKPQESGRAVTWPSPDLVNGNFGGDAEEGFCQNGSGVLRMLDTVKVLHWEEDWFVLVENVANIVMTAGYPFRVRLHGLSMNTPGNL